MTKDSTTKYYQKTKKRCKKKLVKGIKIFLKKKKKESDNKDMNVT